MYVNKCIKCGREFETKNPKRVICPDCLYPDKNMMLNSASDTSETQESLTNRAASSYDTPEAPRYYSAGGEEENQQRYNRPQQRQRGNYNQGGYNRDNRQQGNKNRQSYNRDNNRRSGGYNQRPQQSGYNRNNNRNGFSSGRSANRFNNRRPVKPKAPKQLLVSKEQLEQIEVLYKVMLPLPNPDCHEVIGEKIGLEPRKVFFGINLVRQKMMLPKLPFPRRKLAISPDQLFAIKNLYEPLLPLPPIGCHKIIAAQLKMDEWRVHVGIGLIRSQMGLNRWNQDRPDVPEAYKLQTENTASKTVSVKTAAEKPKRGRKPKQTEETSEE